MLIETFRLQSIILITIVGLVHGGWNRNYVSVRIRIGVHVVRYWLAQDLEIQKQKENTE